jgi:Uma2 family endonuclease
MTMGIPAEHQLVSVSDYLAGEQVSEARHEYVSGVVHAMAGASRRHNRLALRLSSALANHLRGSQCEPFVSDMKVRVLADGKDIFYYPDVVVTCDPRDTEDLYLRFPCLIIEILSESTERLDRLEKFDTYRTIPTLEEYVLVSQERPEVTVFRRARGWEPEVFHGEDQQIILASVDMTLSLAELFAA